MNDESLLSEVQVRALEALAEFRLLSLPLMQDIGVGRDRKHLGDCLRSMYRRRLIGRTATPPMLPGIGRLPHLYWLRKGGAELLGNLTGETVPPSRERPIEVSEEIPHRLGIVETHIALKRWADSAGISLDWFLPSYGPGASTLKAATAMPHKEGEPYIPDAVALVTLPEGGSRLLVIEVYRGGRRGDAGHFRRKLPQLLEVAQLATVERHFKVENAARFLVIFSSSDLMRKALSGWPPKEGRLLQRFFVKSLPFDGNFGADWVQPHGDLRPLFRGKLSGD